MLSHKIEVLSKFSGDILAKSDNGYTFEELWKFVNALIVTTNSMQLRTTDDLDDLIEVIRSLKDQHCFMQSATLDDLDEVISLPAPIGDLLLIHAETCTACAEKISAASKHTFDSLPDSEKAKLREAARRIIEREQSRKLQ
jgi:hypothetical protein